MASDPRIQCGELLWLQANLNGCAYSRRLRPSPFPWLQSFLPLSQNRGTTISEPVGCCGQPASSDPQHGCSPCLRLPIFIPQTPPQIPHWRSIFESYWRNAADTNDDATRSALRRLNDEPVASAEDALAALDWLIHDGHSPLADCYGSPDNPWPSTLLANKEDETTSALRSVVTTSLLRELFNYIAATARQP